MEQTKLCSLSIKFIKLQFCFPKIELQKFEKYKEILRNIEKHTKQSKQSLSFNQVPNCRVSPRRKFSCQKLKYKEKLRNTKPQCVAFNRLYPGAFFSSEIIRNTSNRANKAFGLSKCRDFPRFSCKNTDRKTEKKKETQISCFMFYWEISRNTPSGANKALDVLLSIELQGFPKIELIHDKVWITD